MQASRVFHSSPELAVPSRWLLLATSFGVPAATPVASPSFPFVRHLPAELMELRPGGSRRSRIPWDPVESIAALPKQGACATPPPRRPYICGTGQPGADWEACIPWALVAPSSSRTTPLDLSNATVRPC